jgi:very-short-patch-repair endonuclease
VRQSIPPVDRAIARIASRQKGLITWRQLLAAGVSKTSIKRWLREGRLHRVFRGVYLVGHEATLPFARELAAVLSYGADALLSHSSGVALWQFLPNVPETVHVTVPGRHSGSQPGIVVHRSKPLHPAEKTRLHDIPVTTPARALLDFAETRPDDRDLQRAFSEAQARKLITPRSIRWSLAQNQGRHGAKPLAELLHRALTQRSDSDLEELLLSLIRQANLPEPEMQVVLLGKYRVDFLWRNHNTVAEADGGAWHLSQQRRDNDNRRDSELRAAGYKVERFTDHELTYEPLAAIKRLTRAIYA